MERTNKLSYSHSDAEDENGLDNEKQASSNIFSQVTDRTDNMKGEYLYTEERNSNYIAHEDGFNTENSFYSREKTTIFYTDVFTIQKITGIGIYHGPGHPLNMTRRLPGYNYDKVQAEIIAINIALQNLLEWDEYDQGPVIVRTNCYEVISVMKQDEINENDAEEFIGLKKFVSCFPKGVQFEYAYEHREELKYEDASELTPLTLGTMSAANGEDSADRNVEMWKIKKLIKSLEMARGNGTSMISLIIPPRDQIARVSKMLADEYGTASNIKSRVNRLSVLGAITSVQARLKLYNKVPPNGLVVYCGTIVTDDGKEKKVNIDFEPFKPVNTSLYLCDNKFHTEALQALLTDDNKFGFIVMDGNGSLFGTLQGNTREVLHKFTVDLPKKHGRGGQSALRFARLRMEKRHNYVRKVAETAVEMFIKNDKVCVAGLILAGSADFKTELSQSDMFDQRLQAKIVKVVDISYGGENGFNQAIELSADALLNVKFIQEKKLIGNFFDEISQDTGRYVFGVQDTIQALEMGAVETLICWENLDITRMRLKKTSGDEKVVNLRPEQLGDKNLMTDPDSGAEMEVVESLPLLEWLANNYKSFGAVLEIVTDKSQEGAQFVKGFGGIGGVLRYRVDFQMLEAPEEDDIDLDDY